MIRSEAGRVIEKIKKKIATLLQRIEERQISILSSNVSNKIEDVIFSICIKNQQQLKHWMKTDFRQVLFHFQKLHQERDVALECVKNWKQLKEKQKKTLQIIIKAQERCLTAKDERNRLREKIASLQKEMMTHEEKIHELKEALVRKQDKNASFETDLTRSRREFRKSFSPFIIAGKKLTKFSDLIVFTENDDSTFKDWYFNMMNKLWTNENYFNSKQIKAVYVIQHIDNKTIKHVNVYRIVNANYFIIFEIIFQVLKKVYEDTDKLRKVRQEYLNLKQNFKKKFVFFYNKFIRNDRLLKYFDRMLMNDLIFKLNKDFRSALVNNSRRFESIVQIKNYLILINNVYRQIQAEVDREIAVKKVVEFFKPFSSSCNQLYFR